MADYELISTDAAGRSSFPTSQGAVVGDLVFTSGHGPLLPGGHQIVKGGLREQVTQTIRNLEAVLESGGSSLDRCVRVLVLLKDYELFAEFNEIYKEFFNEPYPPRMAFVTDLVHPDILVEMHAIGVAKDG